jgi:hypothetical protein
MAIRKSEEYEVGGDKVGIERLKAPFDGDQGPEGVVASYMDGFFFLWRCDPAWVTVFSFLRFLDHTQRRTTVGRTPLDE